ncbi:MAG: hypothetical protein CMB56_000420 [Methanobacteriota archaeon]|nr:MAG: hypothetical protein CMB56_000420 [Euryarchaeota archaeon]|tara:strand:+ start:292 stop:762 length:471 start_codon:yes stop_codon:yes gene_type:complete
MGDDDLVDLYRSESAKSISEESERRINSKTPMKERIRLRMLSLIKIVDGERNIEDLMPALLERLGPVRAALEEHGGGMIINNVEINQEQKLDFILTLNGACIACGAAPGTLIGIKYDLENDEEINSVFFDKELLDSFDDLSKEFLLAQTVPLFKIT